MLADYQSIKAAKKAAGKTYQNLAGALPVFEKMLLKETNGHFKLAQEIAVRAYFSSLGERAQAIFEKIESAGRDEAGLYERVAVLQALNGNLGKISLRDAAQAPLGNFLRGNFDLGEGWWLPDFFLDEIVGKESPITVLAASASPLATALPVVVGKGQQSKAGSLAIRKKTVLIDEIAGGKQDFPLAYLPSLISVLPDSKHVSFRMLEMNITVSGQHIQYDPSSLIEDVFVAGRQDFHKVRQALKEYVGNMGFDGKWVDAKLADPSTYSFTLRTPDLGEEAFLRLEASMKFPIDARADVEITLDIQRQKVFKTLYTHDYAGTEELKGMELCINKN